MRAARPILKLDGVSKAFGGISAVNRLSLTLAVGERRAIIGPNGAGKTTLFNVITHRYPADSGRIWFKGRAIERLPPFRIWRLGISRTFQITSVFPRLSCLENVQVGCLSHARRTLNLVAAAAGMAKDAASALLESVGLVDQAGQMASMLSHGDRKRLELAVSLAGEPELLLLDEPTAGMAPKERLALMDLVLGLAEERGLTLLFTEHDMDVVFTVARTITVMHQGSVLAEGSPQDVRRNPQVRNVYLGWQAAGEKD